MLFWPLSTPKTPAHFLFTIRYINNPFNLYFPPNFISVAARDLGKVGHSRATSQNPSMGCNILVAGHYSKGTSGMNCSLDMTCSGSQIITDTNTLDICPRTSAVRHVFHTRSHGVAW